MLHDLASFKYGEMIYCDFLYENLGFANVTDLSSLKLADLDEIFSARKVFHNARNGKKTCSKNSDCLGENYDVGMYYHIECSPFCQRNGRCSRRPLRANLAHLCGSLLYDVMFNPVVMALSAQAVFERTGPTVHTILNDCMRSLEYNNTEEYLSHIRAVSESFIMVKKNYVM
jgi:hypothetical protein